MFCVIVFAVILYIIISSNTKRRKSETDEKYDIRVINRFLCVFCGVFIFALLLALILG